MRLKSGLRLAALLLGLMAAAPARPGLPNLTYPPPVFTCRGELPFSRERASVCSPPRPGQATGPGLPNLTYPPEQVWSVIGHIDAATGAPRAHGLAAMHQGYLVIIYSNDGGDFDGGFSFFDISNPYQPVLVAQRDDDTTQDIREAHGYSFSRQGERDYVVLQATRGIQFWDWSDVTQPQLVSYLELPGISGTDYATGAWWVFWQPPYVYVGGSFNGLYIVHAADPAQPFLVDRGDAPNPIPIDQLGGFRIGPVWAVGNLLVVSGMDMRGYATLDISDPENPGLIHTQTIGLPRVYSAVFNGHVLYGAGSDGEALFGHDLSDPTQFVLLDSVPIGGRGGYVTIQDGRAHVGASEHYALVDVHDPAGYTLLGTVASGVEGTDEDFATVLGNLTLISDDHGHGSFLVPHQAEPDTTGPAVTMLHPPDGALNQALTTRVGVTFSDQIDLSSLHPGSFTVQPLGGAPLAGSYSVQTGIVNFAPAEPLLPATVYEVIIPAGGVQDYAGNPIAATFRATFATGDSLIPPLRCLATTAGPTPLGTAAVLSVTLLPDGRAGQTEVTYVWDFGDGTPPTPPQTEATTTYSYSAAGHYTVQATVSNGERSGHCAVQQTVHHPLTANRPAASSTIVVAPAGDRAWVVNPDNHTVTALNLTTLTQEWEQAVGRQPRTLALAPDGALWVVQEADATLTVLDATTGAVTATIPLPYASRPYAVAFAPDGSAAYITLLATGQLLRLDPTNYAITGVLDLGPTPRGVAITADSARLFAVRFISPADQGEVYAVDLASFSLSAVYPLAFDPGPDTEASGRGVPNGLQAPAIAPDGRRLWLPSKKDNTARGLWRDGLGLTFDSTVRAIVSQFDLTTNQEVLAARVDLNDRDLPMAVAFSPLGDYAFVAVQGTNTVDVLDATSGERVFTLEEVGLAPQGLALTPDGQRLVVHSFLSRSALVYEVSEFGGVGTPANRPETSRTPLLLAEIGLVQEERLPPDVLEGKRLFYNADDRRMNQDGYLACATCHLDDRDDGRVWDRLADGEGLRNTISLIGRAGMSQGRVHVTANFDEIQDFEHDMRALFGGQGFMADELFYAGTRSHPLGDAKSGLTPELDALAAYLASLDTPPLSPYRQPDGSLTAEAEAGRQLFYTAGCAACHHGPAFSDSTQLVLHDVGTLQPSSGTRLGEPLLGLDTPSLRGLWESPPYLHDGSAATLLEVLTTRNPANLHGDTAGLSSEQLTQLVAYLQQIDSLEEGPPIGPVPIQLTAPADGTVYPTGATLTLTATVSDASADPIHVAFYTDGVWLGEDAEAPYTWAWSDAPAGWQRLWAVAVYADGRRTISNEARVTVEAACTTAITYVSSGRPYALTTAALGAPAYIDRSYTLTALSPELLGQEWLQTANDDAHLRRLFHLRFSLCSPATVYVGFDQRAASLPPWLADGSWTLTELTLTTSDEPASPLVVYARDFPAGMVTLGGNRQGGWNGARSHYVVVIQTP